MLLNLNLIGTYIDDKFIKISSVKNILPIIPHSAMTDHSPIVIGIKNNSDNCYNELNHFINNKIQ